MYFIYYSYFLSRPFVFTSIVYYVSRGQPVESLVSEKNPLTIINDPGQEAIILSNEQNHFLKNPEQTFTQK